VSRDLIAGLAFLALGVGVCLGASRLGFGSFRAPEPGFFPWLGGLALVGLSGALLVRTRGAGTDQPRRGEWARPAMLLGALVLYVPILEPLGYPVATTALCTVALRILRVRGWAAPIGTSVALAVGSFLLFRRALGVELPPGILTFLG
jgi:putative tricarboxylic transport membrane protein